MEHINIPEDVYETLLEGLGFAGKKPIKESKEAEAEETEVNEGEVEEHFCPLCEAQLPDEFDDDVLMERLNEIYEQLDTLNEALAEDSDEDESEETDEDSDEGESEDED